MTDDDFQEGDLIVPRNGHVFSVFNTGYPRYLELRVRLVGVNWPLDDIPPFQAALILTKTLNDSGCGFCFEILLGTSVIKLPALFPKWEGPFIQIFHKT